LPFEVNSEAIENPLTEGPAMPRCRTLILPVLLAALPAQAAEGYHLWYDEDGQAVYSQFAPGAGRESETVRPPPPPAESPEVAKRRLQEQLQRSEDLKEDEALAAEKAQQTQSEADAARQRCEAARKNLEVLNGRPRQLVQLPDGTVKRLSEEERQAQRDEMQQIIDESCQ
jgi:hypothetical protein